MRGVLRKETPREVLRPGSSPPNVPHVGGRWTLGAVLAASLVVIGCAGDSDADDARRPSATVPEAAATTTTTGPADPYAVPPVIDEAYVNRVLAGLDAIMGDATRSILRAKTITTDAYARMRAVYQNNQLLQLVVDGFEADMREDFRSYKPNPGNTSSSVTRLVTATSTCIFAQVHRDYSAVGLNPSPDVGNQWVVLTPLDPSRDPNSYNRTSWAFTYDGVRRDRSQPQNPCGA